MPGQVQHGNAMAQAWLTANPAGGAKPLAIWSCWDEPMQGAVAALRQAGRTDVVTVSINGSPQGVQLVKDGDMTATVFQPAFEEGKAVFQAILDASAAGSAWPPKTIEIPGIVVTKDNVDKFLADHPNGSEALQQNRTHEGRLATGGPSDALIDIRGLSKHFGGEIALHEVDMDIQRGEVHGLVGANGAGKSTLIRCLAGVTVPDNGTITIAGQELRHGSPQAAETAGLAFIHQELNLVPHFNAIENILLGAPKVTRLGMIDWKRSSVSARAAAKRVGIKFSLEKRVSELSIAERWLVMISKALVREGLHDRHG